MMKDSELVKIEANKAYEAGKAFKVKDYATALTHMYFTLGRVMDNQVLILRKLEDLEEKSE